MVNPVMQGWQAFAFRFTVVHQLNSPNSGNAAEREMIHLNTLSSKPPDGRADGLLFAGQFEGNLAELFRESGTSDTGGECKLLLHLTDDLASDTLGRIGEPVMA